MICRSLYRQASFGRLYGHSDTFFMRAAVTQTCVLRRCILQKRATPSSLPRRTGGGEPDDLPHIAPPAKPAARRDVFIYFISAAKERNPAAAIALLQHLDAG